MAVSCFMNYCGWATSTPLATRSEVLGYGCWYSVRLVIKLLSDSVNSLMCLQLKKTGTTRCSLLPCGRYWTWWL